MKGPAQTSSSAANQVRRLETQAGAGTPLHAATASRQERRLEISTCRNYRRGEYFQKALAVSNAGTNPAVLGLSVTAGGTAQTGKIMLALGSQTFLNDADGNLTNDYVWCYQWDAENRLIQMDSVSSLASTNRLRLVFEYDWRGRRIRKTATRLDTSAVILDNKFLYDDWNQIAELNATNNNVIRSYVWGVDLSGSLQGAGGVGGLLMVKDDTLLTHFVAYDLNGNVAGLVSASYGTNTARYEYGPFGELLRATGPMAKLNPFRFSTKYQDDETDLVYYGYRYYNASMWRFLSRDTMGENGGENLYSLSLNDPTSSYDFLGLYPLEYWSQGKVYYDGPGEYTLGITSQVLRDYAESGIDNSASAYIFQSVIEVSGCGGGICNSGVARNSSSFVRSRVTNVSKCPVKANCICNINWSLSNSTPGKKGRRTTFIMGSVLGVSFFKAYNPKRQADGSYLAAGSDSITKQKRITLAAGASQELYNVFDNNADVPDMPGAGFLESISGNCSCTVNQ